MKKKILFICFIDSIHSARWINQLKSSDEFEIKIFPSRVTLDKHYDLNGYDIFVPFNLISQIFKIINAHGLLKKIQRVIGFFINKYFKKYLDYNLRVVLESFKPDVVHTLETQHAGYLFQRLRSKGFGISSIWWHSNWGSDIQLFSKIESHKLLIVDLLMGIDYYSCECNRDVLMASSLGFKGTALQVYPNTGGFQKDEIKLLRANSELTSKRKVILLKGYQGWAGRALIGIRALERCSELLKDYTIKLYSVAPYSNDIEISVALFTANTGVKMEILPNNLSHHEMLLLHSSARISIGLSVGDGISTSLLEAMAMGSFPIQSNSSCCNEWFEHGISGYSVNAEDSESIEKFIRLALLNDELVNSAAIINYETIKNKADKDKLENVTLSNYRKILYN